MAERTAGKSVERLDRSKNPKTWQLPESQETEGKIGLEEFYLPASDANGHGVRINPFRVPVPIQRDIEILLASKKFPYKTQSDMLRHAIFRHLKWLHSLEQDLPNGLLIMEALNSVLMQQKRHMEFMDQQENIHKTISDLLERKSVGKARQVVAELKHYIDQLDDEYWRSMFMEQLIDKYGFLLMGDGVRLSGWNGAVNDEVPTGGEGE